MSWIPTFKLYASNGSTLVYTFANVIDLPDYPIDNPDYVELKNKRGAGSIIISGGNKSYSFKIKGVLIANDYASLITAMNAMQTAIVANTNYVFKLDTSSTTTDTIKVKRVSKIEWEGPARRTKIQYYTVEFLALSWN